MSTFDYNGYNSSRIEKSGKVERFRKDIARHLGGKDFIGIQNQWRELYDNAADETVEFYRVIREEILPNMDEVELDPDEILPPLEVYVEVKDDWTIVIQDMGRGFPCDTPLDPKTLQPTGEEPGIFPAFEDDSAGGKKIHDQGGYKNRDISGMHGAGACVSKAATSRFEVETHTFSKNAKGEGEGVYKVLYIEGERQEDKGDAGLVYIGPLTYDHQIDRYRELGIPRTGTKIEYIYDDTVLKSTYENEPCDPYDKENLLHYIKVSLLGVVDRNSIKVILNFKGDITEVTPYDYTPQMLVGYDEYNAENDTIAEIELSSDPDMEGTDREFYCRLYLNYDENGTEFKETTVVNRLLQRASTTTKALENAINQVMAEMMAPWFDEHPEMVRPRMTTRFKYSHYFKAATILSYEAATFDSQTKDHLISTEFLGDFSQKFKETLEDYPEYLEPCLNFAKAYCESQTLIARNEEIARKKEKKAKKDTAIAGFDLKDLRAEIDDQNKDMRSRIEAMDRANKEKSKIKDKYCNKPPEECSAGIFEGNSAITGFETLIDTKQVNLDLFMLTGKIPNVYDPKNSKSKTLKELYAKIFYKDYKEYLLFTDPDPDGAHIRMQFLAAVAEFRKDMLMHENVYIIRAPYGRVYVPDGITIEIDSEFEGKIILEGGKEHFVNSYFELNAAIAQGATYREAYPGAASVVSKCAGFGITAKDLITDPRYKVPVKAPTKDELEYLRHMLTPNDKIKKQFTAQYFSERLKVSKFIKQSDKTMRVKTDKSRLLGDMQRTTTSPILTNMSKMNYYNIGEF